MGYFSNTSNDWRNSNEEIASAIYTVNKLQDKQLLPRVTGGAAVPIVSGLRVAATALVGSNTQVSLAWTDPDGYGSHISGYNVYAQGALTGITTPQLVGGGFSPAVFAIQASAVGTTVVFTVQTVMSNGQVSALSDSPTTATVTL